MGQVYLARSPGSRLAAVKVIRPELADERGFRSRFAREIAAARQVGGAFTAAVMDADPEGDTPWLATAYVPGPSLADAVEDHGPLPVWSVLALAAGLAEALRAIHAAGLVHRDLKPSNVLLADDGPRVIDFGISRAAERSVLTTSGTVMGSPGFLSPEQAEGRDVGPESDVFSLGAVLAYASSGEGPFGSGPASALLYRVVNRAPDLTSVPDRFRPILQRCLDKDPSARPALAELLAEFGTEGAVLAGGWLPASVIATFDRYVPIDDRYAAGRDHDGSAAPDRSADRDGSADQDGSVGRDARDTATHPSGTPLAPTGLRTPTTPAESGQRPQGERHATEPAEPAEPAADGDTRSLTGVRAAAPRPPATDAGRANRRKPQRATAGVTEEAADVAAGAGSALASVASAPLSAGHGAADEILREPRAAVSRRRGRWPILAAAAAAVAVAVLIPVVLLSGSGVPTAADAPPSRVSSSARPGTAPATTVGRSTTPTARASLRATRGSARKTGKRGRRTTGPTPSATTLASPAVTQPAGPSAQPTSATPTSPRSTATRTPPATHSTPAPTKSSAPPKSGPQTITSAAGVNWISCASYGGVESSPGGSPVPFTFSNQSGASIQVTYITTTGAGGPTATVAPGGAYSPTVRVGDDWMVLNSTGACMGIFGVDASSGDVVAGS